MLQSLDLVFSWVKENVMKEIYLLQSRPEPKQHVCASSLLLQYKGLRGFVWVEDGISG